MIYFFWGSGWHKSSAFIDAAGNFMDNTLAKSWKIPLITLQDKLTIASLDNRPLGSGQVTHCTIPISVEIDSHQESLSFLIIDTPEFPVTLGLFLTILRLTGQLAVSPDGDVHVQWPELFRLLSILGGLNDNSGTSMSQIHQGPYY